MTTNLETILTLTIEEKLQLLEDLWDDIAATSANVPVPEWQKLGLDRRKRNLAANPESATPWEEVRRRLRARHGI